MIEKLNNLDRRWIFLVITLAVALPLLIQNVITTQVLDQIVKGLHFDGTYCRIFPRGSRGHRSIYRLLIPLQ